MICKVEGIPGIGNRTSTDMTLKMVYGFGKIYLVITLFKVLLSSMAWINK